MLATEIGFQSRIGGSPLQTAAHDAQQAWFQPDRRRQQPQKLNSHSQLGLIG